ncbi:unnamed protein product [Porites evermanni]|uniref:Transposase Helix-turn-helix domain-containing protein n=1 Tax=Porites evermanni TaxID=104178 RepID=A0ABN8LXP4_9CNID|nr:unnamed protein product [Porites evermanni]
METDTDYSVSVPMQFEQLTRELEVRVYTGLPSPETFQFLFDYVSEKARSMQYWRGGKQPTKEAPQPPSPFELATGFAKGRPGPERKLRLEQEFSLTLMKLRLALLTIDLGFRFHASATTAKKTLLSCFRKLYPKVRCIIDCFECFTETTSGLDLAATLWKTSNIANVRICVEQAIGRLKVFLLLKTNSLFPCFP